MTSPGDALPSTPRATRRGLAAGALTLALAGTFLPTLAPGAAAQGPSVPVVVTAVSGVADVAAAVTAAGGRVLDRLPLIGGVSAELPAGARLAPGYRVVADRPLTLAAASSTTAAASSTTAAGAVSTVRQTLGLAATGNEGAGITVAVVDTGVEEVPGLGGRVVAHLDASGADSDVKDGYGHGTFIAGLVAGTDTGVAPQAQIVDVRVADDAGATSLVQVLRGLQAVAVNADELGIDVVNLSLSSGSQLPYQVDPLTAALDALWRGGLTVVVPSGNDGAEGAGSVSSPGSDPTLLTVGGLDEHATAVRTDDTVAVWSGRGPGKFSVAKPDLVAPGQSVVSLRVPGSVIDTANAAARVDAEHFRGSGTSFSTAVTAGAIAAVLQKNPALNPDGVKSLLTRTTYSAKGLTDRYAAGSGGLDLQKALAAAPTATNAAGGSGKGKADDVPGEHARWTALIDALYTGDAEASARAWAALTPQARAWAARAWADLHPDARAWAARAWAARAWAGGATNEWAARAWAARAWAARAWADSAWDGSAWNARAWAGSAWNGSSWNGSSWNGSSWNGSSWNGSSWNGSSWNDAEWAGWAARAWAARAWADLEWDGSSWNGSSWNARAWAARAWAARAWAAHWE